MIVSELNKDGERRVRGEGPERLTPAPLRGLAGLRDVASLRPFRTVYDLEFDLLALFECPEAGTLNRREVNEHVVAALALNESVALGDVEPLHLAGNTHTTCLTFQIRGETRRINPRLRFRGLDEVQNKDRYVRPYRGRRPAQRQRATLVGTPGEVNRCSRFFEDVI